jgi:altronate dehydratase large subunit
VEFLGFHRPDGSVGIRNYVLVLPPGIVASTICGFVREARTLVTSNAAVCLTARDREMVFRTLTGLGRNPNVGAVVVHTGGYAEDVDELTGERMAEEIAKSGKPVELIDVVREGGSIQAIAKGMETTRKLVHHVSSARRQPAGLDQLSLGVKCGWSDPTSGLIGNPVIGYLFDRLVEAGGTAIFGETTEIIGAEHSLARRAVDDRVAKGIVDAANFIDGRAMATGEDIRTVNPIPANIKAGITTLEEKSLGAIHKAGEQPIQDVLQYAQRPAGRGLYFMDTPASPMMMYPGFAAAGNQLVIFQLGGGGAPHRTLLEPSSGVVSPLIWATANRRTYERSRTSIDHFSGGVIEGTESLEESGESLLRLVLDVASGSMTWSETLTYQEPSQYYQVDPEF